MMPTGRHVGCSWLLLAVTIFTVSSRAWAEEAVKAASNRRDTLEPMVVRGMAYLTERGQLPNGSFSPHLGPAVTALATTGLLQHGRAADDPAVARSLDYLQGYVREDGGIYAEDSFYRSYETALAIQCFSAANQDGRYRDLLQKAQAYAVRLQWDEVEGHDRSHPAYGGYGYGKHKRADLSNTSMMLDALKLMDSGENHEAIQRALIFVSRCQNLPSDENRTPFAEKNPDGGFYYTPDAGGFSQAGTTPEGGLRSYASMTYAGLKSMIYAGVGPDDPRVKAAITWIQQHYDLQQNPGMGQSGLYYYYHTFAKTLAAMKMDVMVDRKGQSHNWRDELVAALAKSQQEDGSWVNETDRWLEGDPNLVTSYALLALVYCRDTQP